MVNETVSRGVLRQAVGTLLIVLAPVLGWVVGIGAQLTQLLLLQKLRYVFVFGTLVFFWNLGSKLAWQGRRERAAWRTATGRQLQDRRPPVLYLRGFNDDDSVAKVDQLSTVEEDWAAAFGRIGPFTAVGRPSEPLPQVGARRLYLGDDWQERVAQLMSESALVVVLLGDTPGLLWELETAVQLVDPRRLVLLIPTGEAEYRDEDRAIYNAIFPKALPPLPEPAHWWSSEVSGLKGVIRFKDDWTPRFPPLRVGLIQGGTRYRSAPDLLLTLRPVFSALGVPWKPPRRLGFSTFYGAALAIVVLAIYLWPT